MDNAYELFTFRPPFTPSNSLAKSPNNWRSPRGSIVEPIRFESDLFMNTFVGACFHAMPVGKQKAGIKNGRMPFFTIIDLCHFRFYPSLICAIVSKFTLLIAIVVHYANRTNTASG